MTWIPTNYKSKSASKDKDEGFKYKKKKGSKPASKGLQGFKQLKGLIKTAIK